MLVWLGSQIAIPDGRMKGHARSRREARLIAQPSSQSLALCQQVPNPFGVPRAQPSGYRWQLVLLIPEHIVEATGAGSRIPSHKLEKICRYIKSKLTDNFHLEDLSRECGLSARALQYAFKNAFGMSPTQWITEQKLIAVRSQLLRAPNGLTVTTAALPYFGNLGIFAKRYRQRFGELPSATLAKAGSKAP